MWIALPALLRKINYAGVYGLSKIAQVLPQQSRRWLARSAERRGRRYASPFDRALILTLDEEGDGWPGLLALGEGTEIKIQDPFPSFSGMGLFADDRAARQRILQSFR